MRDVKEKINLRMDMLPSEQLVYKVNNKKELADNLTLAECRIRSNGCIIGLKTNYSSSSRGGSSSTNGREGKLLIKVFQRDRLTRPQVSDSFDLDVYEWETVDDVKEKIAMRAGISKQEQKLYKYNREPELSGGATLQGSGIVNCQRMTMTVE